MMLFNFHKQLVLQSPQSHVSQTNGSVCSEGIKYANSDARVTRTWLLSTISVYLDFGLCGNISDFIDAAPFRVGKIFANHSPLGIFATGAVVSIGFTVSTNQLKLAWCIL